MQCVSPAELAVLLYLHPVGMGLLILCGVVITVLALSALKCDLSTHHILQTIMPQKKRHHAESHAFARLFSAQNHESPGPG